ncbi:MAG TPA: S1/P1 nuclease [Pirellulales bacterium]|nr:S1/P1 nuclease [Pirellulales bacterium]
MAPCLIGLVIGGLIVPPNVLAWGRDGHVIVAKIADLRLSDKARQAVFDILGGQSIATSDNANWADDIKKGPLAQTVGDRYPNNSQWHFVDIPFDAASYDADRDCKNSDCIVDQLNRFLKVVADEDASDLERREALKFVIHFCGDIHQPLHCAERNGDHGGNAVRVASYDGGHGGHDHHMNLHSVWDDNLVYENESLRHLRPEDAAQRLNSLISSQQQDDWAGGEPKDWAWEAHQLAVGQAYTDGDGNPLPKDHVKLDDEYVHTRKLVVRQQLQRAGVRLANVLNEAFGE